MGSGSSSSDNLSSHLEKASKYWEKFCWWELPIHIIRASSKINNLNGSSSHNSLKSSPSVPLENRQSSSTSLQDDKIDKNLELLKEFKYATEVRGQEVDGKPLIIYICKFKNCNKEFSRTWNILDHARMHKGIKPFECKHCSKKFTQKGNLRKHLKTHTLPDVEDRKRYKCEFWDSSYTERYNYKVCA